MAACLHWGLLHQWLPGVVGGAAATHGGGLGAPVAGPGTIGPPEHLRQLLPLQRQRQLRPATPRSTCWAAAASPPSVTTGCASPARGPGPPESDRWDRLGTAPAGGVAATATAESRASNRTAGWEASSANQRSTSRLRASVLDRCIDGGQGSPRKPQAIPVRPPDQQVGVEQDHARASQSFSQTGANGSSKRSTDPRSSVRGAAAGRAER